MNKTDRLLAIVLKLQSSGRLRAEDLAGYFETSKRTIYRDLQALSEAGVPLLSVPGQGYSLMEGYFLPPLSFSSEEAVMLILGGEYVAQNFDERYQASARAATLKIEGVLPETVRQEVAEFKKRIWLIAGPDEDQTSLKELRRAVLESRTVTFDYFNRNPTESKEALPHRQVNPYGLVYYDGNWYMLGYDHQRKAIRNFRLDRLENLHLTEQTFQRPADFQLQQSRPNEDRSITIKARFVPEAARWVRESRYFFISEMQEDSAGLLVTLQVRHETDALGWLLSWGRQAEVLEPATLRQKIAVEAQAIAENYKKSEVKGQRSETRG